MESQIFSLNETQKKDFAGLYILEFMINEPKAFALFLEKNDADLEPVLEWLLVKEYITIEKNERYLANEKGRSALVQFLRRYSEFLHFFDVYSAVDLNSGEFAFANYFEYESKGKWEAYLKQECWEDLRVTVASYKGIDPLEIVFMSFVQEKRFGRDASGWQFDLLLGSVWDEILEICNSALKIEQLGYESDDGSVSGESVIQDVITQGISLIDELHSQETELNGSIGSATHRSKPDGFTPIVDPVAMNIPSENEFARYRDPNYRSGNWDLNQ